MRLNKKLRHFLPAIIFVILAIMLLAYQNCGKLTLLRPQQQEEIKSTPTPPPMPPGAPSPTSAVSPTPEPPASSPDPNPSGTPVITDSGSGIANPNPVSGMGGASGELSGKPWRPLNGIAVGNYWVAAGQVGTTTGNGGLWILKEDGSAIKGSESSVVWDVCKFDAATAAMNLNIPAPYCAGRNHSWSAGRGIRSLHALDSSHFIFLAQMDDGRTYTDTATNKDYCSYRTVLMNYELRTPPASSYPYPVMKNYAWGCFSGFSVAGNYILALGQKAYTTDPVKLFVFRTSDLSLVSEITPPSNQPIFGDLCSVGSNIMSLYSEAGVQGQFGTLAVDGKSISSIPAPAYTSCLNQGPFVLSLSENAPSSLFTLRVHQPNGNRFDIFKEVNVPFPAADYKWYHMTKIGADWVLNYRQYIWVGNRPMATLNIHDAGIYDPPKLTDVIINSNGFILSLYADEMRISRILLP